MGKRVKVNDKRARIHLLPHVKKAFADAEAAALSAMGLNPEGGDEGVVDPDDITPGDDGNGDTHIHLHMDGGSSAAAPTKDDEEPPAGGAVAGGDLESRVAALEQGQQSIIELLTELKEAQGGVTHTPTEDELDGDGNGAAATGGDDGSDDPSKAADAAARRGTKTGDSAALKDSYQSTLALCEVLWPGFRMPTFDAAASRQKTIDAMCAARRRALDMAYSTQEGQLLINRVHGVATDAALDIGSMNCAQVATLFKAAAGAKSLLNSGRVTDSAAKVPTGAFKVVGAPTADGAGGRKVPAIRTNKDLNEFFSQFYGRNKA